MRKFEDPVVTLRVFPPKAASSNDLSVTTAYDENYLAAAGRANIKVSPPGWKKLPSGEFASTCWLPDEQLSVTVSWPGFKPLTKALTLRPGQTEHVDIELEGVEDATR